jgi:glycosyltransferase involved in cell wall biosynthesis
MRIAVLRPQVPIARGGAEIFTDELVTELRARGHEADLLSVPFKWYPGARVLTQAFLWRMLDLEEADGRPIDVVVATKVPSYVVRHPEKRVWLVHQFRQAYELDGTELGQFGQSAEERALRRRVQELDRRALGEATRLFATSANVAGRLERATGLHAEVLPHPPQALPYHSSPSQGFVLSASRLDRAKRIDLLLEAAALEDGLEVVIASDGPDRERLEEIARARRLDGRVRFEGRVDAERLAQLYATCSSVYYAPVDEDFGMGPFEAFLSGKPVITATDAGGPLDVVSDRRTGLVVRPEAAEIGSAAVWLRDHEDEAAAFGRAGKALADEVTWDRAIARLFS